MKAAVPVVLDTAAGRRAVEVVEVDADFVEADGDPEVLQRGSSRKSWGAGDRLVGEAVAGEDCQPTVVGEVGVGPSLGSTLDLAVQAEG